MLAFEGYMRLSLSTSSARNYAVVVDKTVAAWCRGKKKVREGGRERGRGGLEAAE